MIYGLGIVLSKAVSFIMLPVYTRYLTPTDYGVMELIQMTLEVISIAAGAQLALGVFRYYHKAESERERNAVVSTALFALAVSYTLVGVAAFLAAGMLSGLVFRTAEHTVLIQIASVGLIFQSLLIVPLAYARMRDRAVLFVIANGIKLIVGLALNIVLVVHLGMGVKGILISSLVANVVVGSGLTILVLREVGAGITRSATKDLLRYGLPLIGMHFANFISTFSDRYFLQAAGDAHIVGLYTLAYQFGFMLALGYTPFATVWEPKRFEIAKAVDRDHQYSQGFIHFNLLAWTVALGISLLVGDLLRVMSTPAFHGAAQVVPVILIAYILQGWTGIQDIGILIREKTEYVTLSHWAGAITALIAYAVLVPRYLAWGAAIGTVLAFAVRHLVVYYISQRMWPVRYRWAPVARLILVAVGIALVGVLLPSMEIVASVGVRAGLFLAFCVLVWNIGVLSDADKAMVRAMIARVRARILDRRPRPAGSW